MKDIWEYYSNKNLALKEEEAWTETKLYQNNLDFIQDSIKHIKAYNGEKIKTIVELGCGSGWIPKFLPLSIDYTGIDMNDIFLNLARAKNSVSRKFIKQDIRTVLFDDKFDLSICFAVIKHFSLNEVNSIIEKVINLAHYSIIQVNIARENKDDGIDFHHTYLTGDRVISLIKNLGKVVIFERRPYTSKDFSEVNFLIGNPLC